MPACTAETSASCSAVSRVRALKQPASSHKALLPKTQDHGKTEFKDAKMEVLSLNNVLSSLF